MATLIAPANTSPVADAEVIRKAVKGWGTREKDIISVIGHRNANQRQQIRIAYEENFQEDLIKRLESELTGHFEKAVYRWMLDPVDRDAVIANVALKQSSPDYGAIIELSIIYSPEEFLAVKRSYQARYKRSLEEDLAAHTSGDLGKFLVALAGIYRYDGGEIDTKLAKSEAGVLHKVILDKAANHEDVIRIVSTRSKAQLVATFNRYKDDFGASITKHLKGEPGDKYLAALRATIKAIEDPQRYYEKVLRLAINKAGTDEDTITRVIVARAEKDLQGIVELYYKRNSVSLDQAIAKRTSGDYKTFIVTLLGNE